MTNIIHIVFGDSARGTLRYFFASSDSEFKGEIIGLQNDFSMGPMIDIDSESGVKKNLEWLRNIYTDLEENDYMPQIEQAILKEITIIKNIGKDSKVIIWHGENACDQAGLRCLTSGLRDRELFETNVSTVRLDAMYGTYYQPRCLAECSPDVIPALIPGIKKMNAERIRSLCKDFENIKVSKENLRIFKDDKIIGVDESYYDNLILYNCSFDFQKAARVIGETMGTVNQLVGDMYLEYRVRKLIENGKLGYRGKLLSLRDYEIKLKESI